MSITYAEHISQWGTLQIDTVILCPRRAAEKWKATANPSTAWFNWASFYSHRRESCLHTHNHFYPHFLQGKAHLTDSLKRGRPKRQILKQHSCKKKDNNLLSMLLRHYILKFLITFQKVQAQRSSHLT